MATIGLDKLFYSKITEAADGTETYGAPIAGYKNAIMDAMYKGTKRNVESEDEPSKNA